MRVVLLGPPGTGKGSLALLCEQQLGLAHLSAGEIFRQEIARKSLLGTRVQKYVRSGRLVPDPLVVEVMTSRIGKKACRSGFILDGFPRTRGQAEGLDAALGRLGCGLDGAIYLSSPEATLVRRLAGRRVCPGCGANYHVRTMRPKQPGVCDQCGKELITRVDDRPATIQKRLQVDHRASKPLMEYYRSRKLLWRVDGRGHIDSVFERAKALFRKQGWLPA